MKVIKHGNTLRVAMCYKCGAKLEYCGTDFKTKEVFYYRWKKRIYIKCPECGVDIGLNENFEPIEDKDEQFRFYNFPKGGD